MAGRSKRTGKAVRLPSGKYAWRGRAVPFSRLPKAEQSRFRASWASKAAKSTKQTKAIRKRDGKAPAGERRKARDWLQRRTTRLGQGEDPRKILETLGPSAVNAAHLLQTAAHKAYKGAKSVGGGKARQISDRIRDALGDELASAMPQLWWYH